MSHIFKRLIASLLALILFAGTAPLARAASPAPPATPAASAPEDGEADDSRPRPASATPTATYRSGVPAGRTGRPRR